MKKLIALFMTMMLLFTCAAPALAAEKTVSGIGAFTLPDEFTIDDTTYVDESTETSVWMFDASSDSLILEVFNDYSESDAEETLSAYTEEQLAAYIDGCVTNYSSDDYAAVYVETVKAGDIPFVLFSLEDADGSYYMALTVTNGWCLNLVFYSDDGMLPQDQLTVIEGILASYVPAA